MTRPTPSQAVQWRPDELRRLAEAWDETARDLHAHLEHAADSMPDGWRGAAADAARSRLAAYRERGDAVARALIMAAVAARDGSTQLVIARRKAAALVRIARQEGFGVADDGSVLPATDVAGELVHRRAEALTRDLVAALDGLGMADVGAARDIAEAFAADHPVATVPAGASGGPSVPWDVRIAESRTDIAQAILDEVPDDPAARQRIDFYRSLLGEVDDPTGSGRRVDRQILAFDPDRGVLVELNGYLKNATSVAVFVPGMNTTLEGSATHTRTARQFVTATRGEVAAITFLGGPFPADDNVAVALTEAADPRFAVNMAPRLVAFSRELDDVVEGLGRPVPVTYVGHSYGGSILGTAEAMGLTADRTVYVAAAGAGVGVDDAGAWHNRNPDVLRFSMTGPGDPIELVQGLSGGPHGADPDEMDGVIQLDTGRYADGRLMGGISSHTDILNSVASDSWRNVLAVITGDRDALRLAS